MYRYENITSSYNSSNQDLACAAFPGDVLNDMQVLTEIRTSQYSETSSPFLPNSIVIPGNDFDMVRAAIKQELCYTAATNYCTRYGSPGSLGTYDTQEFNPIMQRSVSSHSLQKNMNEFHFQQNESSGSSFDPVRKVFSTGDLHRINMVQQYNQPLSDESCITEGVNAKASRYSPEKRKERIERYRSKRRHRNFNKKIKYVCRKTLADSRPRIRGRFVRSDEIDKKALCTEWNHHIEGDEDIDDDDENWIHFLDAF